MMSGPPATTRSCTVSATTLEQMNQIHAILESLDRGIKEAADNRRAAPRINVRLGLMATPLVPGPTPASMRVYTRNLSRSGVAFVSRKLFKRGERVALSFKLQGQPAKLVLAEVTFCRYVRNALYEAGAQFVESIADSGCEDRIPGHWMPLQ